MKRTLIFLAAFVLLSSHELFLKSDSYYLEPNQEGELFLFNGTFDQSEGIVSRDRIINPKIIGPQYEFMPEEKDYYDKENATYLKFKTGAEGTYVAGISTLPQIIELKAEDFKGYLEHEGLSDVVADRQKKGIADQSAREQYAKHVKAILQVSDQKTGHFKMKFGYPVEFIPNANPYDIKVGDKLSFTLLKNGKPLANHVVRYASRSNSGDQSKEENSIRTDEDGTLEIEIDQAGKWYVATIHMVETEEENLDYVSNWATLTFEIR